MATLYEINQEILSCVDTVTGKIFDLDRIESLCMDKKEKVRNIVCYIKNLLSDAKSYEEEEKVFAQRKTAAKNKAAGLKEYLAEQLQGEVIKDKEFSVSWRKSQRVEILDESAVPADYLILMPPKVDRAGLKDALKRGEYFDGITLQDYCNIQIK